MPEIVKSNGQFFPNGEAIEIVRDGDSADELGVAHWNRSTVNVASALNLSGKIYQPPALDATFVRALRLPSNFQAYGSASALVDDLAKTFLKYVGLSVQSARLISFFVMGTWLRDTQSISPRLVIVGPASRELDQLTKLLSRFCRHSMLLSGVAPNALLSMPFSIGLTLIMRERNLRKSLKPLLDAATSKDRYIPVNGGVMNPFCSVVLITEKAIDNAYSGMEIEIPVWPTSDGVPWLDAVTEIKIESEMQNKLLAFRLENFDMARSTHFEPPELLSAFREVACFLGSCFPDDPDLQGEIVSLLRRDDKHVQVVRSTNPEAVMIEALLFFCHSRQNELRASIHIGELAKRMRIINMGRGETSSPSARGVGEILRRLGFQTTRLDKNGRGIFLCSDISERVHELAVNFGVPSIRKGTPGCVTCEGVLKAASSQKQRR